MNTVTEPIADLSKSIPSIFDDHGLSWCRLAGREWAKLDGFTLLVTARADSEGFFFGVIDDRDQCPVRTGGPAPTRPAARAAAVACLASFLVDRVSGPQQALLRTRLLELARVPMPPVTLRERMRPWAAVAVVIGVVFAAALLAILVRVAAGG